MTAVITVQELGKCYKVGHLNTRGGYRTLRESLSEGVGSVVNRLRGKGDAKTAEDFWALRAVDFKVQPGEVVGIIGRNGAGKSTLLKILSRVTKPTTGQAEIRGRVGSLLEVGTGFHPELTGRENIYLNGAILGMSRNEISRKFDEIVGFAEVERFLDTPVKRYSSGMYVRLAFAVAAYLEPEVLLVDEVLAVGDVGFQKKCLGRIGEVAKEGRTILFVSHNMAAIQSLCSRIVLLREGGMQFSGNVDHALALYAEQFRPIHDLDLASRTDRYGKGDARYVSVEIRPGPGRDPGSALMGGPIRIAMRINCSKPLKRPSFGIAVYTRAGQRLFQLNTWNHDKWFNGLVGNAEVICDVSSLPLLPGSYLASIGLSDGEDAQDVIEGAFTFEVLAADVFGTGKVPQGPGDLIFVESRWEANPAPC